MSNLKLSLTRGGEGTTSFLTEGPGAPGKTLSRPGLVSQAWTFGPAATGTAVGFVFLEQPGPQGFARGGKAPQANLQAGHSGVPLANQCLLPAGIHRAGNR